MEVISTVLEIFIPRALICFSQLPTGYKTLEVIQGNADAYVHVTLIKKWDLCAGNAILNAVHGNMTTLDGLPIDYSSKEQYKNDGGVLATLHDHQYYLPKLQRLRQKPQ